MNAVFNTALATGFADPAREAQAAFKAAMWALARPGQPVPLATSLAPPAPLGPTLAALALALIDFETAVWVDAPIAGSPEALAFLRFHTSARIVADPAQAAFALISDAACMPPLTDFAQGEPDYPDRSATLMVAVERFSHGPLVLRGPGIDGAVTFGADPLPADMPARLTANRAAFPLGIDLLLAAPGAVAGLPRSVRLVP